MTEVEKKKYVDKHITEIYPQLEINMTKVCGDNHWRWGEDLLSTSVEFFLNKPLDVQYESCINNKAENFITYIANFQLKSSTTRFWHVHRKHSNSHREYYPDSFIYDQHVPEDTSDDDLMLCIKRNINSLSPFEKMLVEERVIKKLKFKDIADRYDIPYTALTTQLKKTLKKLKEKCQHLK